MNILPLVFTLLLMLSILTIEKLDNFRNKIIVQNRYEKTIEHEERQVFNERQKRLYSDYSKSSVSNKISHRQTTFRGFLFKEEREKFPERYKQYRFVTIQLIKKAYEHAIFFKKIQSTHPEAVEELLEAIQNAADKMPAGSFKRIQDIARIKLDSPQLQNFFYFLLKGTIEKEEYKKLNPKDQKHSPGKTYFPLLTFFNFNSLSTNIKLRLASQELLFAIYGDDNVVRQVIETRKELSRQLSESKIDDKEAKEKFKAEFDGKQKPEISDIIDYTICKTTSNARE